MNGSDGQARFLETSESEQGAGQRKVGSKALLALLDRQGRKCALSGVPLTPQSVSLDHITPLERGGSDHMNNVQLVHEVVNAMKGTMSQADFVHWCKVVASHCIADPAPLSGPSSE